MKKKFELKCFKGIYKTSVWHRGALVCHGGMGQLMCEHLEKCIEQFINLKIPPKEIRKMIKKFVTNNKNKDEDNNKTV